MTRPVNVSNIAFGGPQLAVIAGPCVLESIDLCVEIAEVAKDVCARLGIGYVFKASFDKANRSSGESFRGPGLETGLKALETVRKYASVPLLTDIHEAAQVAPVASVVDILQIPAFLCRQTDLITAAVATGKAVNIKKGQFLSPWDAGQIVKKAQRAHEQPSVMLTERGESFGYNNLVVDMRGLPVMRGFGVPVIFDATHSVQRPGGLGHASGGDREFIFPLIRAACAVGVDGLFIETHPRPEQALSDGPNALPLGDLERVLTVAKELFEIGRRTAS